MKAIFLLSVCVASITLSFGRAPSDTSRRSSQAEEVLTSLAAIKAATAKLEQCLAATSEMSSVDSDTASERSNSPTAEVSETLGIQQAKVNALVNAVYTQAIAGLKSTEDFSLEKVGMAQIVKLSKQIQIILTPNRAIADELAPQCLNISSSDDVKRLREMIAAAARASEPLIQEYSKCFQSRIYKHYVTRLKVMQAALAEAASEKINKMLLYKVESKEAPEGAYSVLPTGWTFINKFSKEYAKLGLMRQVGINDDKSLMVLDAQNPITPSSLEDELVANSIKMITKLATSQLDLTLSGVVVDYMMLLKSGVNLPSLSHKYYVVFEKKVFITELKDGRYVFNQESEPVHVLTEEELITLTGMINTLLRAALERCNFKSPKFAPIRFMLAAKVDLIGTAAAQASEATQETTAENE
jgi:hypothetical protein